MKLAFVLAALLVSFLLASQTRAATPAEGTLDRGHEAVTWSGGRFAVSNPTICPGAQDPTCDHFLLTIDLAAGTRVQIAIAGDRSGENWDLFVFYPDGPPAGARRRPVRRSRWSSSTAPTAAPDPTRSACSRSW